MPKFYYVSKQFSLLFDRYFCWLLAALLFLIPLYPKFPLFNIPGTYVAIRLEDSLILAVVLIWLFGNLSHLIFFSRQTIFQSIALFWIIGGLSLTSAIWITYFVEPHLGFLHWMRRIEYMSLFIIAATSIRSAKEVKMMVTVLLFTTVVVVLYGFGQIWLNFPVVSTTNKEFSKGLILYLSGGARVSSTFAGHYDLAIFLSMVLVLISSLFFFYQGILKKVFLVLIGIGGFTLLGLTAARLSFVATLVGIGLVFWLNQKRLLLVCLMVAAFTLLILIPNLRHRLVATITVNFMGGGGAKYTPPPGKVTVFTPIKYIPEASRAAFFKKISEEATTSATTSSQLAADTAPGEPINTTELGVYRSLGIRLNVEWPRALAAFYKNPLLGPGYSSINLATDNDFLRSLGEVGLLGTLALGLVFLIITLEMVTFIKTSTGFENLFILGVFVLMITLLLTSLFIDVLEASKVAEMMWLLLGVAWAVMKRYSKVENG